MDFGMNTLFHVEVLLLCKWPEYGKKLLTFWRVLVILTSYVPGKLIRVWNYYLQFRQYLKITESQKKGIKRILQRNSEYIKNMIFIWIQWLGWKIANIFHIRRVINFYQITWQMLQILHIMQMVDCYWTAQKD